MSRLSDIALLLPSFRARLMPMLERIRGQGYKPVVHETLRSLERSEQLVKEGRSQSVGPSMHCYRIAADIICGEHGWDCKEHGCRFYDVLHAEALDSGLTRVRLTNKKTGKKFWDGPHVQGCPVRLQDKVRECAPEHLDTLCKAILAGEVR